MNRRLTHFALIFVFIGFVHLPAQTQVEFGLIGGVNLTFFDVVEGDFGPNATVDIGYYGGFFADFDIDQSIGFQPELVYIGISDFRFVNAPLYLKFDVSDRFHVLVGPSLNYFFDFFNNNIKIRADLSLAFDVSKRLNIHLKYTLGIQELSPDVIFLGLGYRL